MLAARVQCFLVWCSVMLLGVVFVLCCLSILPDVCDNSGPHCTTTNPPPKKKKNNGKVPSVAIAL